MPDDEKTVNQRLDAIANGQAEIRADTARLEAGQQKLEAGQEDLRAGQERLETRADSLEAGQRKLEAGQEELRAGQERLETRVENLEAGQERLEAGQEELRAGQQKLEAGQEELRAGQERLESRVNNLEAGQERLEAGQGELRAGQQKLEAGHEKHDTVQKQLQDGQARLEREMAAIRNDIAPLKAAHARSSALRASYRICEDLGLDEVKILARDELRLMVRQAAAVIPRNLRYSFIEADAIIEAVDPAGQTHYVAMEASFTADARDTDRAIRNAGYLTLFTGQPAHAVIAAQRIDRRIAATIKSGAVSWCRLTSRDLEIE